jgi:N-acetylglucosamine kinase-like BadF-type ATPase
VERGKYAITGILSSKGEADFYASQENENVAEAVFLGVDGGGSKTAALALDGAGNILGTGASGGSNYQAIGLDTALRHIGEAAARALNGRRATVAAFCLSGADMPYDHTVLEPALRDLNLCDQFSLFNDSLAVFRAGSRNPYGVAVVCGTGFNAVGISQQGKEFRLPALGTLTGDNHAGGGGLGILTLGAAFRAWDGRGETTRLQPMVLKALGAPDMPTLAEWLVQQRVGYEQIYALSPLAFAAADAGDSAACGLIRAQGEEVAITILAFLRRLDLIDTACDAVLGGSMFYGQGTLLMDTIQAQVCPAAPRVMLRRLDVKPVVGAALLALDQAGVTISDLRSHLPEELKLAVTSEGARP